MVSSDIILLVEDNPDDIVLTKRALKKSNILNEVVVAEDGIDALSYLRKEGEYRDNEDEYPIVILLDLNMPRMSGMEFLKELRNDCRFKRLPVVILSSSREDRDVCDCYNLGANSYIQKPVDFEQFVKAIQTLGLYWLVLNIRPKEGNRSEN
ncbi:MAG: response regulator [Candidatus Thorarchaeota archaeon]